MRVLLASLVLLFAGDLFALTLDYDLSTSLYSSGEGVWNAAQGRIEPQLHVRSYDNGSGPQNMDLSLGSGEHGVFNASTYQNFDRDGSIDGGVIEIDTSVFTELLLTGFHLESGYTLRPVGDQPLVLKIIGDVQVDGTIDCSGAAGQDLSDSEDRVSQGGQGNCGGADGGDGGAVNDLPQAGSNGGASVTGGQSGDHLEAAGGHGGGGGGGYNESGGARDPTSGLDELTNPTGNLGTSFQDRTLTELAGGSGGGGGGAFDQGLLTDSNGGGGGGGGGVIYIIANGSVDVTGQILANGGKGGGDTTGLRGGGGGGGAGGTIVIFSGGFVTISGAVSAQAGAAGTTNAADGGDGGKGAEGRTWITDYDFNSDCGCETPQSFLTSLGVVRKKTGESEVISQVIDTSSSFPEILSGSLTSSGGIGGASSSLLVAVGNTANFTPAAWEDVNSVTQSPGRYLRFKVVIDNDSLANPHYVNSVSISLQKYTEQDFEFTGGCGRIDSPGGPQNLWPLLLILLPLFWVFYLRTKSLLS